MATQKGLSFSSKDVVKSKLSFKPRVEDNNLCKCVISELTLEMIEISSTKADGSENTSEYVGQTIPRLTFLFKQEYSKNDSSDRFFKYVVEPINTIRKEGTEMEEDTVNSLVLSQWHHLKHILEAFEGVKGYDDSEVSFTIDPMGKMATRLKEYANMYKIVYDKLVITEDDVQTPIYKGVKLWLKLVAEYKKKTYFVIPSFIRKGFIERVKTGQIPTLEFASDEQWTLSRTERKAKGAIDSVDDMDAISDETAEYINSLGDE